MFRPVDAVIAVTYKCNSRCTMCSIWQIQDHSQELTAEQYLKLPASLKDINISGGEAFLRPDLPQIIKNVKIACPRANIIISSNGFATDLIKKQMQEIIKIDPNIGIAISLDGIAEAHNQTRGIPDGFEKCLKTIKMLKNELGIKKIKIAFTLNKNNVDQMLPVYELSKTLNVGFTMSSVHSSEIYFGEANEQKAKMDNGKLKARFDVLIKELLDSWQPKNWARAYYVHGIYELVSKNKQLLPDYPAQKYFYLDPNGLIFPSVVDNSELGNIKDRKNLDEIQTEFIKNSDQPRWMVCTARTAIKKHWLFVGFWVFANKIKSYF